MTHSTLRVLRQMRLLLGDRLGPIWVLAIASLLSGLAESGVLAILAQVAAALVDGASQVSVEIGPMQSHQEVGALLVVALVLALVRLVLQGLVAALPARISSNMQAQLRSQLFEAFTRASWTVQSRDREGYLQETLTNQVMQITAGTLQATILVSALLTFSVLVLFALVLNVVAALVVLVTAICLFGLLRPLSGLGTRRSHSLARAYVDYAAEVSETTRIAEEAHVFGANLAQRNRAGRLVHDIRSLFFQTQMLSQLVSGVYQSLVYLLVVFALLALNAADAGHIASLGAVVLLLVRAGTYGQQAQGAYQSVRQAIPYLEHVQEAQQRYAAGGEADGLQRFEGGVQTLEFQDVAFAYEPDRPVLSDIRFKVDQGETIGIVGPSGAGKSTLVQILLGLRSPDDGCYLVNGLSVGEFKREDWHRHVAFVPQEPRLIHASVSENIRFFRDLDDDSVRHAARQAGIHEDIETWSNGYDSIVGPRADAVSGGQQQRICLARALAARPDVLVLDEPTSALDPHSEQLIQRSLTALKQRLTLFVVAHRMSTLDICERVMVIVDGRLEAFDTIEHLRNNSAYYRSASALSGHWTSPGFDDT